MSHNQLSSSATASSTLERHRDAGVVEHRAQRRGRPVAHLIGEVALGRRRRGRRAPGSAPDRCSGASVSFSPPSSTSAMATGQPCAESRCARARPMPDAAPVMTTVRPLMTCAATCSSCSSVRHGCCVRATWSVIRSMSRGPTRRRGRSWPMPAIVSSRAPGIARAVAAPPVGWTIRSRSPWMTSVGTSIWRELGRCGRPDAKIAGELARHARRGGVAIPGRCPPCRAPLSSSNGKPCEPMWRNIAHGARHRLRAGARRPRRRHPPPRRQRRAADPCAPRWST